MARIVIFGTGSIGQVAAHYFTRDSEHEVVAFTVEGRNLAEALVQPRVEGLDILPFEEIQETHPPGEFRMFVAVGQSGLNRVRERIYLEAREKGYELVSYVSSRCVNHAASIGDNCLILEHNTLQPFAEIGNDVILWSGNHIGHHSVIGDHCFLTSHVVVSGHVRMGKYCYVGVNAAIRDSVAIGESCVIGAGALIMRSAKPGEVYIARRTKAAPMTSDDLDM